MVTDDSGSLAPVVAPTDQAQAVGPPIPLDAAWILGVRLLPSEREEITSFIRARAAIAETFRQLADLPLKMKVTSGNLAVLTLEGWCLWSPLSKGGSPDIGDRGQALGFMAACRENADNCRRVMRLVAASTNDGDSGHHLAREFLGQLFEAIEVAESHAAHLIGQAADDRFNEALRNAMINLVVAIDPARVLEAILKEATQVEDEVEGSDDLQLDRRDRLPYLLESICGTSDLAPSTMRYVQPTTIPTFPSAPGEILASAQVAAVTTVVLRQVRDCWVLSADGRPEMVLDALNYQRFLPFAKQIALGAPSGVVFHAELNPICGDEDARTKACNGARNWVQTQNADLRKWALTPDGREWIAAERGKGYRLNGSIIWSIADPHLKKDLSRQSESVYCLPAGSSVESTKNREDKLPAQRRGKQPRSDDDQ